MGWQLLQCEAFGVSLLRYLVLISLARRHVSPERFNHHARYRSVSCTSGEDRAEGYGCSMITLMGSNGASMVPELTKHIISTCSRKLTFRAFKSWRRPYIYMYDSIVSGFLSLHPNHDIRRCRKKSRRSPLQMDETFIKIRPQSRIIDKN
jgi:hypothetical protein